LDQDKEYRIQGTLWRSSHPALFETCTDLSNNTTFGSYRYSICNPARKIKIRSQLVVRSKKDLVIK
jgi:hypothetical protein